MMEMLMAGLRKAKLRVYVTVDGAHEIGGEPVTELVVDYQRQDGEQAGPLSGVWTIVRATAWTSPSYRLGMWTNPEGAPPWVVDIVGRYSPDQQLSELQGLGEEQP